MITLQRPPGVGGATAFGINDAGLIVGTMVCTGMGPRAFLHDGDQFIDLGTLPGGTNSRAFAINSLGQIVGYWGGPGKLPSRAAFVWYDDVMTDLHGQLHRPNSDATDINDAGQVVGWMGDSIANGAEAFIWKDGDVTALGHLPDGFFSVGEAINEAGQVVGTAWIGQFPDSFVRRAFLWDGGPMIDLGLLPGYEQSAAVDINDAGLILGEAFGVDGNPNIRTGFIWQNGIMTDVSDLILPNSGAISFVGAINNQGQITGSGHNFVEPVGLLLTPVGVPVGDLDGDCSVGLSDFYMLIETWGPCPATGGCPGDLDGDGSVGITDFLTLLANWTPAS